MTRLFYFLTMIAMLFGTGCRTSSSEALSEARPAGYHLTNEENTCLVPSLQERRKVVIVPCKQDDLSQLWDYDSKRKILRNLGDTRLSWLVHERVVEFERIPGSKSMLLEDGQDENTTAVAVVGPAFASTMPPSQSISLQPIDFGETFALESLRGKNTAVFQYEGKTYKVVFVKIVDNRCPQRAFCLGAYPSKIIVEIYSEGQSMCLNKKPPKNRCTTFEFYGSASMSLRAQIGPFQVVLDQLSPEKTSLDSLESSYKIQLQLSLTKPPQ